MKSQADVRALLAAIDWSTYSTAYGSAEPVPGWLFDLRYAELEDAERAGHNLWASLCHQKGQLASAVLPALPFLFEFLPHVAEILQIEIVDILDGFACCSSPLFGFPGDGYHAAVRAALQSRLPLLEPYLNSDSESVCGFVESIFEEFAHDTLG